MTKLTLNWLAGFFGRAKGTAANALVASPLRTSALSFSLSNAGAGGTLANNSFGPQQRTLAGGANETLDWTNFTNSLQETAQSFGTAIRFFYLVHLPTSTASGIRIGNVGAGAWLPLNWPAATTLDFKPGEFVIIGAPTTTGLPVVGAGARLLKVLNLDGANAATYEVGSFGS